MERFEAWATINHMRKPSPLCALLLSFGLLTGLAPVQAQSLDQLQRQAATSLDQLRWKAANSPENPAPQLALANQLLENLRKAWAQRDPNATGPAFQAQADQLQRAAQELIGLYEKVIALEPNQIEARVNLAEVYFVFLSQFDQAETLLNQALALAPGDAKAQVAMAEFTFFFKGDHAAAIQRLEQALQASPADPTLSVSLADLLTGASQKPEDFDKARQVLQSALAAHPGEGGLGYMLASVWYREANLTQPLNTEKAETALRLYTAELAAKPELELVIEVAQVAQALGHLEQARSIVETGLNQFPAEPRLRLLLGDLWLQQGAAALDQGQLSDEARQAEEYYRGLLAPADFSTLVSAQQVQLYYNLGLLAYLKGQASRGEPAAALSYYHESEKNFRSAMAIFDRINIINRPLQQELAKTLEAIGRIESDQSHAAEASEHFKQACDLKLDSSCDWLKQHGQGQ